VLIGTVNMDETTHGLSDKVLDRASVIEFWDIDVNGFPGWKTTGLDATSVALVREVLCTLVKTLRPVRLHFGWRTIGDVIGYVEAATGGGAFDAHAALDHAIYSKILPKLRGEDTPRLRAAFDDVENTLRARNLTESANKVSELATDLRHLGTARFWR
jgi:5-methylcytosine-specific restriction enzyme B